MDSEEIVLTGEYKNFKFEKHYLVDGASDSDVIAILSQLSEEIEPYIYKFAGIDTEKIDVMVKVGNGVSSAVSFLKSFKRNNLLPAAQNKNTMLPIAESYLLNQVLKKSGVRFKTTGSTSLKPQEKKAEDEIVFVGNCKEWFAVKKLTVNEKTEDWEVAGILAGINHTIVNKLFDFAKMSGTPKNGRKSLSALADALLTIDASNPYEVCKTCEGFGIKPYAAPEMLMNEYPDIKPPKMKGRKPKG